MSVVLVVSILAAGRGCSLLTPLPAKTTVAQRLEAFPRENLPIQRPVTIYWDEHQIPFIEAERDEDLAVVLGMVHAHLRLGQMELFKRVATGRTAEIFGPSLTKIDHSLRILDLPKAADAIYASLPPDTRRWLDAFLRGVNFYQDQLPDLPHEFKIGGLTPEPWTPRHIIAMGRLTGIDINWLTLFMLLPHRGQPYYAETLDRFLQTGGSSIPSFDPSGPNARLIEALGALSRSGSNSIAVSGARAAGAGAILANDPHLGITVPGLWIIVGVKSPSHHAVGMMFPGLPVPAIGRNPHIAWGGTNMRAASSDVYDLSAQPPQSMRTRQETISVRWWFDRTVDVRDSPLGPVISDAPILSGYRGGDLAVRWIGHEPSDEFTPMLRASRARNWREFRAAFDSYAIPGMNILYADADGNIGQLMAVKVPRRAAGRPKDFIRDPRDPAQAWRGYLRPADLPTVYNPAAGFLVSCNNVPAPTSSPVGYLFSSNDRLLRIASLLSDEKSVDVATLREIQQDVYSITDTRLRDLLLAKVDACGLRKRLAAKCPAVLDRLDSWDGRYTPDSRGAVAFQAVLLHFAQRYYRGRYPAAQANVLLNAAYAREFLTRELAAAAPQDVAEPLAAAFEAAAPAVKQHGTWGRMHRLKLGHIFANIPLLGRRYRFGDFPAAGANETVHKTAHRLSADTTDAFYGSCARHISDLSDPNANYFVLLGGQDGWLNSAASLDQVPLWRSGRYVKVPLDPVEVRKTFPFRMNLK